DVVSYGSQAAELGLDFDQEILTVEAPVDRRRKEWMWLPGGLLLALVVGLQWRRYRRGEPLTGRRTPPGSASSPSAIGNSAAPLRRRQPITPVQHYLSFGNSRLASGRRLGGLGTLDLLLVVFLLLRAHGLARCLDLLRSLETPGDFLDLASLELPTQITFDAG